MTFLLISGTHPSEILDWTFWRDVNDKYFILKYYEYYFRVSIKDGEEILLDTNLFLKINEEFSLKVDFNKENKEQHETVGFKLSHIEDDTYTPTIWTISYQNGKFYEISRFARNYGRIK